MEQGTKQLREMIYISFFNILHKYHSRYFILNTLHSTLTEVNQEIADYVDSNKIWDANLFDDEVQDILFENGVLTMCSKESEQNMYSKRYFEDKANQALNVMLLLSSDCNLRCPYCYLSTYLNNNNDNNIMPVDKINAFIKWLQIELESGKYTKLNIEFYGGEPLLAKHHLKYIIDHINELTNKHSIATNYAIVTNGTLLDEQIAKLLITNKCNVQITIDGKKKTHDKRRLSKHNQGTFDVIIENIKLFLLLGGTELLNVRMNIDKDNFTEVKHIGTILKRMGISKFGLGWVNFNSSNKPNYTSHFDAIEYDDYSLRLFKILYSLGYISEIDSFRQITTCMLSRTNGYVMTTNLDVYKCEELIMHKETKIGAINDDGIMAQFNINLYDNCTQRDPLSYSECKECKLLPLCGAGCAVKAFSHSGHLHNSYCEFSEKQIKKRIENYINATHYINQKNQTK